MSLGLVGGGGFNPFRWFGDRVKKFVDNAIDKKMHAAGEAIVARAQQLAPVATGALRNSINYVVMYNEGGGRHELVIQVGMPYGVYQEFGTRFMSPHPYIRPAINRVGRLYGFDLTAQFAGAGYNPATGGPWHGLLAGTGRTQKPGFAASAHPRFKQLTSKQVSHVTGTLIPSIKRHHRGQVKRTRFMVG